MCGPEVFIEYQSGKRSKPVKSKSRPSPRPRPRPSPKTPQKSPRAKVPVPTRPPIRAFSVDSSTTAAQSADEETCLLKPKIVECEPKWSLTIEGSPRRVKSLDREKRSVGPKERRDVWMSGFEAGKREEERKKAQVAKFLEEEKKRAEARRREAERIKNEQTCRAEEHEQKKEKFKEDERAWMTLAEAEKRRHEEELTKMRKRQREQELAQAVAATELRSALEVEARKQGTRRKAEAFRQGERDRLIKRRDPTDHRSFRQRVNGAVQEEQTTLGQKSRRSRRSDSMSSVSSHSVEEIVRKVRRAMSILSFSERERERWSKRRQRNNRPQ